MRKKVETMRGDDSIENVERLETVNRKRFGPVLWSSGGLWTERDCRLYGEIKTSHTSQDRKERPPGIDLKKKKRERKEEGKKKYTYK